MDKRKLIDSILVVLAVMFLSVTTLAAFYYAPLEPVDVLTVLEDESDYIGDDIRVKGVVHNLTGQEFSLWDISSPDPGITIDVAYSGSTELSTLVDNGDSVYVVGRLDPDQGFSAKEIEIADDPNEPAGWTSPYLAKIFYFHVPSAWTSFLAFGVVLACSVVYLLRGGQKWDVWALSSAEVGLVFNTVAVVSGALWAKAEWGHYWDWSDAKLFSTFVLWLVFIAYVGIRSGAVRHESIPKVAAVFGILGFVAVPISFISSRIWTSRHPNVVASSTGHLSSEAGMVLMLGVVAFTLVYVTLFSRRTAIEKSAREIQELKEKLEEKE